METFELKDAEGWKKSVDANTDPYGAAVMTYAARWAHMIEQAMATGRQLEDVAEGLSNVADEEGITGFQYGCAVSILSKVWVHGEQLRRWHNIKTQLNHEGELANEKGTILNPALLTIG